MHCCNAVESCSRRRQDSQKYSAIKSWSMVASLSPSLLPTLICSEIGNHPLHQILNMSFVVGCKVKLSSTCTNHGLLKPGQVGVLIRDAGDHQPFLVKFEGNTYWYRRSELELADASVAASSAVESKGDSLIIKRVTKGLNLRVRKHRSLVSDEVGLLQSGAVFAFSQIDGEWAKLSPRHYLDLQSSRSCVASHFKPHDPDTEGYCIISTQDFPETLEEPSETERTAVLEKIARPDFSSPQAAKDVSACFIVFSFCIHISVAELRLSQRLPLPSVG